MPRNSSGVYTLPPGNPVTTRTIIESSWANNTMSDIANEITESLARNGAGGMTGPMKAIDGTAAAPSITFGSETSTGLYRVASGQLGITTGGAQRFNISSSGSTFSVPVTVNGNLTVSGTISGNGSSITSINASNITSGTLADARLSSNVPLKNAANAFTENQSITANSGIALAVTGVANQYAASFYGGTAASGDLNGINVYGSTPNYVVSRFSNSNTSGSTSIEVIEGSGTARAFVSANSGVAGFGSNTSVPVHIYSANASRITLSTNGNVTINAPSSGSHTINGDVSFVGTISGNGSGLTNLNASNISSGTIADARLSSNVPLKNASNAFTASQTISGDSGVALTVYGVPTQFAALFSCGSTSSGDLSGIDVAGSTPNYVVSRFRNTNTSGSTSIEIIEGGGVARAILSAHNGTVVLGSSTSVPIHIYSANSSRITISSNGNVTINAPTSGTTLYVYGDIYATGTITQGSDERLKTNVQTIDGALAKVSAMRGVSFTHKDTGQRDVGVIAQEVAEVVPEVVREDENGYLSVAYGNMVGVLIEAVKELRDEVWQLKAKYSH